MQMNMSCRSDQFFDFETEHYTGGTQRGMGSTMSSTDYDVDSIATQFSTMSFDQMSTPSYQGGEGSYSYPYSCPYLVTVPVPVHVRPHLLQRWS